MREQHTPSPDGLHTWLTELGPDAYALVRVATGSTPPVGGAPEPALGETGIARPEADLARVTLEEVTEGSQETLHRWLQLDNGQEQLAIISAESGVLHEHTPGELAAQLMHGPDTDEAPLAHQLASWMYRRNAEAPQGLGWIAAATAWACHMRAFTSYPPPSVLARSLQSADEHDEVTEELVVSTGRKTADLFDRLERTRRPRSALVEDWRAATALAADAPALQATADWLLDQIALRDAHAQQLRAVLEPDITDHLRDRHTDGRLLAAATPGAGRGTYRAPGPGPRDRPRLHRRRLLWARTGSAADPGHLPDPGPLTSAQRPGRRLAPGGGHREGRCRRPGRTARREYGRGQHQLLRRPGTAARQDLLPGRPRGPTAPHTRRARPPGLPHSAPSRPARGTRPGRGRPDPGPRHRGLRHPRPRGSDAGRPDPLPAPAAGAHPPARHHRRGD
ncbi:hypothetical protein O1L68_40355 [Streptomyces lydicus]|nr:hypothetical protein [Streptomyces lydicus]